MTTKEPYVSVPSLSLRGIAKPASGVTRAGLVLVLAMAGSARSQTFLEPEEAGPDFAIQGEYGGTLETGNPMGVQVVALGGGAFKAVFLPGGLPGQGWNGIDRMEAAGALGADGTAGFSGGVLGANSANSATASADGTTLSGKTDQGEAFTFHKVFRKSPTEGAPPPPGAIVLFDGTHVSGWKEGTAAIDARKLFKPVGASSSAGAVTKDSFSDFTLHLEFREPFQPANRYTSRGNSGIYLQSRYEVQVLDSFGANLAAADSMVPKRECGAIFEHFAPRINMAYPPLAWQTLDIAFTAARFDAVGTRVQPANATVLLNGEPVQDKRDMLNRTLAGEPEGAAAGPLRFQAYDSPVFYRNIWIIEGASALRPRPIGRRAGGNRDPRPERAARADGRVVKPDDSHPHFVFKGSYR
jgi:3-keto-disaccharide hydrolase